MDAGYYVDHSEAEKTTLGTAFDRYRREIVFKKKHSLEEPACLFIDIYLGAAMSCEQKIHLPSRDNQQVLTMQRGIIEKFLTSSDFGDEMQDFCRKV